MKPKRGIAASNHEPFIRVAFSMRVNLLVPRNRSRNRCTFVKLLVLPCLAQVGKVALKAAAVLFGHLPHIF